MGDAVMSLPFIRAAQARFEVHVCCSPAAEPIFRMVLGRDQVHGWRPPWLADQRSRFSPLASFRSIRTMASRLMELRASHAVCAWSDPRTGLLMSLAGVPSRIGFASHHDNFYGRHLPWRRRQLMIARALEGIAHLALMRPLLTRGLRRRDFQQHHVEDWRQVAGALGLELDTTRPPLALGARPHSLSPAPLPGEPTSRTPLPLAVARPRIAIHPGASEVQKRWPLQHFVELGHALSVRYDVSFVEPPEMPLDAAIRDHFPVISTGSLTELADRLREVDAFVGNDAGVGHLADALGTPVVAIFISSEPRHFAPFASRGLAISFAGACDVRPCLGRCTKHALLCLAPVSYGAVAARIEAALDQLFA